MNLRVYIEDYKFNSLRKVMIGKHELIGLVIQKGLIEPIFFYSCNVYGVYTRYRVLPPENGNIHFELLRLLDIKKTDEESHHYRWLRDNCKFLKSQSCIDMRVVDVK